MKVCAGNTSTIVKSSAKIMKLLVFIFLITSLLSFGQKSNVSVQIINDLNKIDTLYRQIPTNDYLYIDINYQTNKIHFSLPYTDSIVINAEDTLSLRNFCNKVKRPYEITLALINLMIKNGFLSLAPSGPGDCIDCSIIIYNKKNEAYIVFELKNRCLPNHCYEIATKKRWKIRQAKPEKITENILRLKHLY
jgi:hypothetical protein